MAASMKEDEIERVMLGWLQKKGYKQAEEAFKRESKTLTLDEMAFQTSVESETGVSDMVSLHNDAELFPEKVSDSYAALRDWVSQSLDMYKCELTRVLYPLFVHCYLELVAKSHSSEAVNFLDRFQADFTDSPRHAEEIGRLRNVVLPEMMRDSEIVATFRRNKYDVRMSAYSLELLVGFLHDRQFMLLLSLLNQYIGARVYEGRPQQESEADAPGGIVPSEAGPSLDKHVRAVHWGVVDEDVELEDERPDAEGRPRQKRKAGEKQAAPHAPPLGKDGRPLVPMPTTRDFDKEGRLKLIRDARQRVALGQASLPSACMYTFVNGHGRINSLSVAEDASLVCAGMSDSTVRVWPLGPDPLRPVKDADRLAAVPMAFTAGETDFESRYKTFRNKLLDESKATASKTFVGHSGAVYATSFSPDNRVVVSASEDGTVRMWSMETLTNVVCYRGHNSPVWDVSYSPVETYFATASHDRTARLWSAESVYPLRIFAGHLSDVDCVRFHPNTHYVATGSTDRTCRLWEVTSGECVRVFTGHFGTVSALAFSPDGKYLASAGEDRCVMVWDLGSGRRLRTLYGHDAAVYSLAFSADGAILASGGADYAVRLWDARAAVMQSPSARDDEERDARHRDRGAPPSPELLKSYLTKATPVYTVNFTRRNLLLCAGVFTPPSQPS